MGQRLLSEIYSDASADPGTTVSELRKMSRDSYVAHTYKPNHMLAHTELLLSCVES